MPISCHPAPVTTLNTTKHRTPFTGGGRHPGKPRGPPSHARQADPVPQDDDQHGEAAEGARDVSGIISCVRPVFYGKQLKEHEM